MASATEFSSSKTVLILSLVIGCFAILWPKIFYPMLQASISSTADAPYSQVSGVYHSSILPCCHPVPFSKELNALYFIELCNRLKWRAGQRRAELQLPPEPRHDIWTPGLARWCADELARTCGLRLDEPALERYRRAAHRRDGGDAATANLTRCLETSYDLRREEIRPARLQQRQAAGKYSSQERPSGGHPGLHRDAPHAAAAAAHSQTQNMARQPRRPMDRMARPGGPQSMRPGMPGGGYGGYTAPQTKGSGAMGIIMPIYTVGIVIFFVYTIMRVMFKRQPVKEAARPPPRETKAPAAFTGYRLQPADTADARPARPTRSEPAVERRVAAAAAAAPTQKAAPPPASKLDNGDALAGDPAVGRLPPPPAPVKQEEAEIDQLRRRLEDTERAMERIMKQMSTVSQKLNAAKINSNIRALKQELWGSVDSLASDSLASDYSLSLDSRHLATDPSWRTYSLETGSATGAPPAGYTRDNTASVASAVSRLARSVSQLSLEMETAAGDDASMPAETGAELSELGADGDEAADVVDGVVELRHDGANAVRRYESLEALQSARGDVGVPGDGDQRQVGDRKPDGAAAAAAAAWPFEPRPEPECDGAGAAAGTAAAAPASSGPGVESTDINAGPVAEHDVGSTNLPTAREDPRPGSSACRPGASDAGSSPSAYRPGASDAGSSPSDRPAAPLDARSGSSDGRPTPSDRSTPDPRSTPPAGSDSLHHPHVIVLGLRTKRTPEREPRTLSFRLGGDASHVLASCRVDGDSLPPQSAVLIRETETRAGRPGRAADQGALQTSLELEIRGMEATAAPRRADWTSRLQAATETSLASIEDDLDRAAKALKNVTTKDAEALNGKEVHQVPPGQQAAPAGSAGVQQAQDPRHS